MLCVSDLHLEDPNSSHFQTLVQIAALAAGEQLTLALLGDIVEVWVGDDDDAPLAHALKSLLAETARHTSVGLMCGNRDFLYGRQLSEETGATLLPDPCSYDGRLLLTHGDRYCTDDASYQQMRTLFHSQAWQEDVLGRSLDERRALAAGLRAQSRSANALKAANIMDVNAHAVLEDLQRNNRTMVLHGHTHRPAHHRTPTHERWVLGDWGQTCWVCVVPVGAAPALFCLPFARSIDRWWTAVKAQLAVGG